MPSLSEFMLSDPKYGGFLNATCIALEATAIRTRVEIRPLGPGILELGSRQPIAKTLSSAAFSRGSHLLLRIFCLVWLTRSALYLMR